jgi:acyl-CoA thioesterase
MREEASEQSAQRPFDSPFWRTLGYRQIAVDDDRMVVEWDAGEEYSFPGTDDGAIIHGGMVATLLDTAMGGACLIALGNDSGFLTADLRTEFFRPARPGLLRAEGRVIRRTRGVAFCAADVSDADGNLVASARCTQIVRSSDP